MKLEVDDFLIFIFDILKFKTLKNEKGKTSIFRANQKFKCSKIRNTRVASVNTRHSSRQLWYLALQVGSGIFIETTLWLSYPGITNIFQSCLSVDRLQRSLC